MRFLKKNKRMIIGITIAVVLAVIISTISCYVLAETLINSRDVVYQDNSNLMADNVQDAIDGTCSKIDARLKGIEDELYTIKKIKEVGDEFTTTMGYSYTGLSITFPANSYCTVHIGNTWASSKARGLILAGSKDSISFRVATVNIPEDNNIYVLYSNYFDTETTYYVWARHASDGNHDIVGYEGWCATKYK